MYATTDEQRRRTHVQNLAAELWSERRSHLLRIALANAASRPDAEEALQQSFLAFLAHFDPGQGAPPIAWLTLTLKRECWATSRRNRLDRRTGQEADADTREAGFSIAAIPADVPTADEVIERAERIAEARQLLAQLKPAERRALGLIAAGYSYREIAEITGWTHTKINRCAAEGRATLRELARDGA